MGNVRSAAQSLLPKLPAAAFASVESTAVDRDCAAAAAAAASELPGRCACQCLRTADVDEFSFASSPVSSSSFAPPEPSPPPSASARSKGERTAGSSASEGTCCATATQRPACASRTAESAAPHSSFSVFSRASRHAASSILRPCGHRRASSARSGRVLARDLRTSTCICGSLAARSVGSVGSIASANAALASASHPATFAKADSATNLGSP